MAGSIEVLLESSIAKRLGVHGSTATGLPKGTPSSIVVGTAVLVTTKAGQGTLHIKFSSRTSARLKHVRKLKLMLRLFARNASAPEPPDDHLAKHGRPQPLIEGSCPERPTRAATGFERALDPAGGQNPGGWRTAYPAKDGWETSQRDAYGPLRPAVSNHIPLTSINVWPALA